RGALAADVEHLLRGGLQLRGERVAGDARLEVCLAGMTCEVALVELIEESEVVALRLTAEVRCGVEIGDARLARADDRALIEGWQPAVAPVLHAHHRQTARIGERDKRRQV